MSAPTLVPSDVKAALREALGEDDITHIKSSRIAERVDRSGQEVGSSLQALREGAVELEGIEIEKWSDSSSGGYTWVLKREKVNDGGQTDG